MCNDKTYSSYDRTAVEHISWSQLGNYLAWQTPGMLKGEISNFYQEFIMHIFVLIRQSDLLPFYKNLIGHMEKNQAYSV